MRCRLPAGIATSRDSAPGIEPADYVSGVADGVDEVLKAARYQIKHGAKVIKICATAGVLSFEGSAGAQQYTIEELRAAAEEAHRHGLKIAAHAHGTAGIIASSQAGIDSIEHNSIMTEEAARLLKKNGTFVVPNLYLNKAIDLSKLPPAIAAKMNELKPVQLESFRRSLEYKFKISFGTDAGVFPHGENAREFAAQVALGQTPLDAIRSATVVNAELFGTPDRGRIEAGLLADVIAVDGQSARRHRAARGRALRDERRRGVQAAREPAGRGGVLVRGRSGNPRDARGLDRGIQSRRPARPSLDL